MNELYSILAINASDVSPSTVKECHVCRARQRNNNGANAARVYLLLVYRTPTSDLCRLKSCRQSVVLFFKFMTSFSFRYSS